MKAKIRLETLTDIKNFVSAVNSLDASVFLTDGEGFCVSGKSIMGALYTLEWSDVYVTSDKDIYSKIKDFVADD